MQFAMMDGQRIGATPGARAICPGCEELVIAKCGAIVTWHWAHVSGTDCDKWAEGETDWHLEWKARFKQSEVTIRRGDVWHRADAVTPSGWIVEFQHSYLSVDAIRDREKYYRNLIWIFDVRDARTPAIESIGGYDVETRRLELFRDGNNRNDENYVTFRWKFVKKTVAVTRCATYLDLGDGWLLQIGKMYFDGICAGWGYLTSYERFMEIDDEC